VGENQGELQFTPISVCSRRISIKSKQMPNKSKGARMPVTSHGHRISVMYIHSYINESEAAKRIFLVSFVSLR